MIRNTLLSLAGVAIFIAVLGFYFQKNGYLSKENVSAATVTINNVQIPVDLAKSPEERQDGLSGRKSLADGSGMLFVFQPIDSAPTFWMKGMLFPIDIIWIKEGKIIQIDKDAPTPGPSANEATLTRYTTGKTVDYVLEVNAGFSDKNSFKVGDSVSVSGI